MLEVLVVIVPVVGLVVAANYADRGKKPGLRRAVAAVLVLINLLLLVLSVFQVALVYLPASDTKDFNPPEEQAAWEALLATLVMVALATAILSRRVRGKLARLFPRWRDERATPLAVSPRDEASELRPRPDSTPLFPQMLNYYTADSIMLPRPSAAPDAFEVMQEYPAARQGEASVKGFNPDSMVHLVALALCVYFVGSQFVGFILGGGLEGVAENLKGGVSISDLLANTFPEVLIPLVGVGIGIRRNLRQTLRRLGLERPSLEGIGAAVGVTIALFLFLIVVGSIWMSLVSEETYKEQTQASEALSQSVTSIGLAFLLAVSAAVGEEIAFRGALQPVFGLWPTAILFALIHLQYTLTPAALIILVVAVAFGWIRQRYNTTVAMLTHFLFDFVQLALTVTASGGALFWLTRLL